MYYKIIIMIISDDCKWSLYYKCIMALALTLDLATVVNYDCKWRHNVEHHLQSSFMIIIYNCNIFIIQAIDVHESFALSLRLQTHVETPIVCWRENQKNCF